MTLTTLYCACSNMESNHKFIICDMTTENCIIEYKGWYSIPAATKMKEVNTFGYENGAWYINLVTA